MNGTYGGVGKARDYDGRWQRAREGDSHESFLHENCMKKSFICLNLESWASRRGKTRERLTPKNLPYKDSTDATRREMARQLHAGNPGRSRFDIPSHQM